MLTLVSVVVCGPLVERPGGREARMLTYHLGCQYPGWGHPFEEGCGAALLGRGQRLRPRVGVSSGSVHWERGPVDLFTQVGRETWARLLTVEAAHYRNHRLEMDIHMARAQARVLATAVLYFLQRRSLQAPAPLLVLQGPWLQPSSPGPDAVQRRSSVTRRCNAYHTFSRST